MRSPELSNHKQPHFKLREIVGCALLPSWIIADSGPLSFLPAPISFFFH
jgi:hypothetical protein